MSLIIKRMCVSPDGECVEQCKEGFFVDEESQECEPCHRMCRTCGGPNYDDCDYSCEDDFTLKDGECVDNHSASCPDKHFLNSKASSDLHTYLTNISCKFRGVQLVGQIWSLPRLSSAI